MPQPVITKFILDHDVYLTGQPVGAWVEYYLQNALLDGPGPTHWETLSGTQFQEVFASVASFPGEVAVKVVDPFDGVSATATADLKVKLARKIGMEVSPIGKCGTSVNDWVSLGLQTFPGLEVNKQFYKDTGDMSTYQEGHRLTDNESLLPRSCTQIICYDSYNAGLEPLGRYLRSVPNDVDFILVFSQEAENNKWPSGKAFQDAFRKQSAFVQGLGLPGNIRIAQDSGSSGYNKGGDGFDGSYVIPDDFVDLHLLDFYHNFGKWSSDGIAGTPKWIQWTECVSGSKKPLGIAEYGIDSSKGSPARHDLLEMDSEYLHEAFTPGGPYAVSASPMALFCYWWSDCTAGVFQTDQGRKHQFIDEATITLFNQILAGEK